MLTSTELSWPFWPIVPLYPYGKRQTIRQEVVKDTIWTFDQPQGIFYVVVPIRMTVVRLETGGLLVYAPVAPTPECIHLMRELEAIHGAVRYIILPTVSGLEHKVFVGPFARQFPEAQVYVAANQWSFPINLPLSWLGFPGDRTYVLPEDSRSAPFADEFDYRALGPINLGLGPFEEVAFFHKRSQTLLVTDSVQSIPYDPPPIVQLDPFPLLFHARETELDYVNDTSINRRKGWHRIVLFAFYFRPSTLEVPSLRETIQNAIKAPDRSKRNYFGLFPFRWRTTWHESFNALYGGGRLFVAPVLQTLIFSRGPEIVIDWVDQVCQWDFRRIIPCHLDAPIAATPQQFRQAFGFLMQDARFNPADSLPAEDFELLRELETSLSKWGITPPPQRRL